MKRLTNLSAYDNHIIVKKKDGIVLILYYMYLLTCTYLYGLMIYRTNLLYETSKYISDYSLLMIIINLPIFVTELIPIILIILINGQSIATIGITKYRIIKSIIIGIIAAIPLNALPIYGYLKGIYTLRLSFGDALLQLIYYIVIIGFAEEVIFRGYFQQRISVLISNKYLSILICSLMFAILHIPYQIVRTEMSLYEFIANEWFGLLLKGIMHIIFVYIYSLTKNIITSSIAHGLLDLFNN